MSPTRSSGRAPGRRVRARRLLALLVMASSRTALPAGLSAQRAPDPVAPPAAVVQEGEARFTVLTDRMIRMEWSPDGTFEDRATIVAVNRHLSPAPFRAFQEDGWQVVETGAVTLRYRMGSGRFGPGNLEVRVTTGGVDAVWRPGEEPRGNLGGTIRTLDGVKGPLPLGRGLVSRDGWAVVDDTESPLLVDDWVRARPQGDRQDWYFLGYGHDYTAAVGDFATVSGPMPMPPRFAFGVWWSRYWAYTDTELQDLVRDFDRYGVPLDVLVVDMDWHNTFELRWGRGERDAAGQPKGWTGYSWNPVYFPDPEGFLSWVHGQGLHTTLNLHPASGIQPWEDPYPAMARAVGVDPASKKWIPFHIEDRDFARAYFDHVIHPLEKQGVDFWWLDWQQWGDTRIPGLTPTMWLNHVFFMDMRRQGKARPLIFHRYGGLGSQRYQVGFSGDAASTWPMLAFEPEFTATAANVLYGYWSHDIGGHLPGPVSPELYTRWVQFGALSPVLRTHTTKNAEAERRIWAYPPENFAAMRAAMLLRTRLVPYLYTAAREAWDTGVSMVRPLYYGWPDEEAAYRHGGEYMLGDELLVSPVTSPADSATGLATHTTWLPPGSWVEWRSGARLRGPAEVTRTYTLDEVPLFVRTGAVLPMAEPTLRVGDALSGPLVLTVVGGGDADARMYEDAGNDDGYRRGEAAWTPVSVRWSQNGRHVEVTVSPRLGTYPDMPRERGLVVRIPGSLPPTAITADGVDVPFRPDGTAPGWRYDATDLAVEVHLPAAALDQPRSVTLDLPEADRDLLDGTAGRLARLHEAVDVLEALWPTAWPPESLIALAQTGHRIALDPTTAVKELTTLRGQLPRELARIRRLDGDTTVINQALALMDAPPLRVGPTGASERGTPRRQSRRRR